MSKKFITLRNSVEQAAWIAQGSTGTETGKRFMVIQGGLAPSLSKSQTMEIAIDGSVDVSMGAVRFSVRFMIRTQETTTDRYDDNGVLIERIGSLSEIETYYKLNNAIGSPSNLIHLVDHYGHEYDGFLIGDHSPSPLTTTVIGTEAYYTVEISFVAKSKVA